MPKSHKLLFFVVFQSSRSSQVTAEAINYWSDEQSFTNDQDKHDINNVDFCSPSTRTDKFNRTSLTSLDKNTSAAKITTTGTHGSALKLGSKKTSSKDDKPSKARQQRNKLPGSEFEITGIPIRSPEPDYFADMEPAVSFKAKDSKVIPVHSYSEQLSSKLAMVDDMSQVNKK